MSDEVDASTHRAPKRPTITDVAAAAGVSASAVSLALNGKGSLSVATRNRIFGVAQTLGYAANPMARVLRGQASRIIAINLRSLDVGGMYQPAGVDHFSRLFTSAATTALDAGYGVVLLGREHADPERGAPLWVDGYVIEDPLEDDPFLHRLLAMNMPVVTVGWDPAQPTVVPFVDTSGSRETENLLDHLRERGARRIALISGRERTSWHVTGEDTYRDWSRRHQQVTLMESVPESAGVDGGREAATRMLAADPAIDAIACHTARHAVGAMEAVRASGREVPREVLVAAGSDSELARSAQPSLTTIDLRPDELGRRAVTLLIDRLASRPTPRQVHIEARLLVRESTADGIGRVRAGRFRSGAGAGPGRA